MSTLGVSFIPLTFAVTKGGKAAPLSPMQHSVVTLLLNGPVTRAKICDVTGAANGKALVLATRARLKQVGLTIVEIKIRGEKVLVMRELRK